MRLLVYSVDMRGGHSSPGRWRTPVIDQETGKKVGFVDSEKSPAARHISLFGGKYRAEFTTRQQCAAFAKGVEAVLNHMTVARRRTGTRRARTDANG
jgi:hypothetical protein